MNRCIQDTVERAAKLKKKKTKQKKKKQKNPQKPYHHLNYRQLGSIGKPLLILIYPYHLLCYFSYFPKKLGFDIPCYNSNDWYEIMSFIFFKINK